jgi:nucleoside-diphosphate-sugar epimerase
MIGAAPDAETTASSNPLLLLGAASLIGRFLTPILEQAGVTAFAFSRKLAPRPDGYVKWVRGDLREAGFSDGLPPAHTVISLSPIWLLPAALPALKAKGLKRLVAFSSTSVFTKAGSDDLAERTVAQDIANAEASVTLFCEVNGVDWTILRPTLIYAEGQDQNVSRLARLIRRFRVLPLAGAGEGLRQPVHAEDLARAALDALVSERTHNRAYNLPGGETLSYRQMAERVFASLGLTPRIVAAPAWLWRLGFALARPLLPGATAQMGLRMSTDLAFDAGPAREDFGWSPRAFQPNFR